MTMLKNLFIQPFTTKGIFWGLVDLIVKLITLVVWAYLMCILGSLIAQTLMLDYNYVTQLWWFAYCFLIFFGASLLTYIIFFARDYEQAEEPEQKDA